jgi:hypothetical protein
MVTVQWPNLATESYHIVSIASFVGKHFCLNLDM